MIREKIYEANECENIREIIYETTKKYENNIAFTLKHKDGKNNKYEDITYKQFLDEVNSLGTKLFDMGYKNKRIAIVGKNSVIDTLSTVEILIFLKSILSKYEDKFGHNDKNPSSGNTTTLIL